MSEAPNLGDYLGQLLAEITTARVQADIEAARVAEVYATHPLLRNFPVPRIRLSKVDLNVPVIIAEVPKQDDSGPEAEEMDTRTILNFSENLVSQELMRKKGIKLPPQERLVLRRALQAKGSNLTRLRKSPGAVSKAIAAESQKTLRELPMVKAKVSDKELDAISANVESRLSEVLVSRQKRPPRIKVLATTSRINEIKSPERLVMINLSIREDALEWSMVEKDGEEHGILVPE